jgi:hypothetical protein
MLKITKVIKIGGVRKLKINSLLVAGLFLVLVIGADAQNNRRNCPESAFFTGLKCDEYPLMLDDTEISIRLYTKGLQNILDRTFVVTHNNEQKGLNAVKEVLAENRSSGRLIEVVSNFQEGFMLNDGDIRDKNQKRYLYFGGGKYSKKGIREKLKICEPIAENKITAIEKFGVDLLKIVTLNNKHKFIIGVHNNTNEGGLSLNSFLEANSEARTAVGVFSANNHSEKKVIDIDDFILVSDLLLFVKVTQLEEDFNVALQENKKYLDNNEATDDGSMSIYFGRKEMRTANRTIPFHYMNIEAEGKDNPENANNPQKLRQKKAIRLVMKMKL